MTTKNCDRCGNQYDRCFTISFGGDVHVFDCFECAIAELAPRCAACDTTVIGHGTQVDDTIYCCAHCAREKEQIAAPSDHVATGTG